MPRVPTYGDGAPQVGARTIDPVGLYKGASPEDTAKPFQAMQLAGNALTQAGNSFFNAEADAVQRANTVRVQEAKNKAKELEYKLRYDPQEGYQNLKGISALERPSNMPLADEYTEKYKKGIGEIYDSLGNDAQKEGFGLFASEAAIDFHKNATVHQGEQFRDYTLSVHEGTIKNALRDISLNYNNIDVINKNLEDVKAAAYEQAMLVGKSATYAEAQTRMLTSKAHLTALDTALQKNDPIYADGYLKKYAGDMEADDILWARGLLTKQFDARIAADTVDVIMKQAAPRISTSDSDRAFNILINTESSNRQFGPDGAPLTSPKGAVGVAQVMPDTAPEAAQLAGLEWDAEKYRTDPNYNAALGKAYFQQQLKDFQGNLAQAYAAYNAGPGATRKAIDAAKADGTDWLTKLPEETQGYVQKNMSAYDSGLGAYAKPTLAELKDQVRQRVGVENPERLKLALEETERRYTETEKALKQRDDDNVANAMRMVIQNGGRYTDLPANVRASLPPGDVGKVIDFAQKIAKGDDSTSLWLYNQLESNPAKLTSMSDNEFFKLRTELSTSDFKHFSEVRGRMLNGQVTNSPGELNSSAIKTTLDDRLRMMSIDPSPKDGSTQAVRVGAIRRYVNESIAVQQATTGKKMNDAEVSSFIDSLFAKTTVYRGLFGDSSGPVLGMKVGDIPAEHRKALEDAFKKHGIAEPTDGDILGAYWREISRVQNSAARNTLANAGQ